MPKRVLAARNQDENEPSSSTTRPSGKRLKTDDKKEEKKTPAKTKTKSKEQTVNEEYTTARVRVNKSKPMVVSKTALFWSDKYLQMTQYGNGNGNGNSDPDADDMDIQYDFSCYGELQVVGNCVADLATTVFFFQERTKTTKRVDYVLAFRRLEALTILLEHANGFSIIDDGELFYQFMRLVGACYVTILRASCRKKHSKS